MAELINTRCTQGRLIITDTHIIVERRGLMGQSKTMARTAFSSLEVKTISFSLFGKGGGSNLVFHGGGYALHAGAVRASDVKAIQSILTGRE